MAELEAYCGRLAARRVSATDLAALRETVIACEDAAAASDHDRYYAENERFHHLIYAASGNGFLAEHRAILAALEAGDANAVSDALRGHIAVQGGKFNDLMASYKSSHLNAGK